MHPQLIANNIYRRIISDEFKLAAGKPAKVVIVETSMSCLTAAYELLRVERAVAAGPRAARQVHSGSLAGE